MFAVLCIYPWRNWYFMLLDFVSVPEIESLWRIKRDTPLLQSVYFLVREIIGSMLFQYVVYVWWLVLLWRAARRIMTLMSITGSAKWFGILLAMCNPFIYTRMIEGQANVFVWYGLILLTFSYVYECCIVDTESKNMRLYILYAVLSGLAVSYFIHSIFIVWLLSTALFLTTGSLYTKLWRRLMTVGVILCININRIVWWVLWLGERTGVMQSFDAEHYRVFNAVSPDANTPFHLLSLHWFRSEGMWRYTNSFVYNDRRQTLFLLIWCCALIWCVRNIYTWNQKNRHFSIWFVCVSFVAYVLSMWWSGWWWVAKMTSWMYEYIPFYNGLREPQKWTWVVLFCYVVFGARGVQYLMSHIYRIFHNDYVWRMVFWWFFVFLPLLYTPTMLFAMKWQLSVHTYPEQWKQLKQYLHTHVQQSAWKQCIYEPCYDVLVFPRHQYIRLSRWRDVVVNPIWQYLHVHDWASIQVLMWDNMEMHDVYTQSTRPVSPMIESYIWPQGSWRDESSQTSTAYQTFIQDMNDIWVQYIVVLKEAEWEPYMQVLVSMQQDNLLDLVTQNNSLMLYKIHDEGNSEKNKK